MLQDLGIRFLEILRKNPKDIASIYWHIFSLLPEKQLEDTLVYLYEVSSGKDEFFKERGKEEWFYNWHKSIRQCDFFEGIYKEVESEPLTKEEHKEFKYLFNLYRVDKKNKYAPKGSGRMFTEEYRRYLELHTKKTEKKIDHNVSGHIDGMLWSAVHIDTDDVLVESFEDLFTQIKRFEKKEAKAENE